jgi:OOP family OmpA-OmpF porin
MHKSPLAVAVLAVMATGLSYAGQDPGTWYGGIAAGQSSFESIELSTPLAVPHSDDKNNPAGRLFGGYQINHWLSLEGGYNFLNSMDVGVVGSAMRPELELQGIDLTAKAGVALSDSFDLYARAGAFYYQADVNDLNMDDSDWAPVAALGGEVAVNESVALRLEYQRVYNMDSADDIGAEFDNHLVSLGLIYRFGQSKSEPVAVAPTPAPAPAMVKSTQEFHLSSDVLFGFDKSGLSKEGEDALVDLVKKIREDGFEYESARVEGHTDRIGSDAYNQKLSEARAATVADFLASQGLPAESIKFVGLGESQSVIGDQCKGINRKELINCLGPDRRVVIKIDGVKEIEITP